MRNFPWFGVLVPLLLCLLNALFLTLTTANVPSGCMVHDTDCVTPMEKIRRLWLGVE